MESTQTADKPQVGIIYLTAFNPNTTLFRPVAKLPKVLMIFHERSYNYGYPKGNGEYGHDGQCNESYYTDGKKVYRRSQHKHPGFFTVQWEERCSQAAYTRWMNKHVAGDKEIWADSFALDAEVSFYRTGFGDGLGF